MTTQAHAISLLKSLPEPLLAEVVDFAEFLKLKTRAQPQAKKRTFAHYAGKLVGSPHFNEDPVELQRAWRNEWA